MTTETKSRDSFIISITTRTTLLDYEIPLLYLNSSYPITPGAPWYIFPVSKTTPPATLAHLVIIDNNFLSATRRYLVEYQLKVLILVCTSNGARATESLRSMSTK